MSIVTTMTFGTVSDLKAMLIGLKPQMSDQEWAFHEIAEADFIPETAFALIRESEGTNCIIPAQAASANAPRFARITLQVYSDLEGVGLTAAVSTALARAGIACNVIAGYYHDHLFVPWERREEAMEILRDLSAQKG